MKVYNSSTELGSATVSGTSWSYSASVANGTTYQFIVRETDPAGNTSNATSNFTVTGDTTAPTISSFTSTSADGIYSSDPNKNLGNTVNITATASDIVVYGNTITVTLDTAENVVLTAPANGTTLAGTYTVGAGVNSCDLSVTSFSIGTVTDIAGNAMTNTTVPSNNNINTDSDIVIIGTGC